MHEVLVFVGWGEGGCRCTKDLLYYTCTHTQCLELGKYLWSVAYNTDLISKFLFTFVCLANLCQHQLFSLFSWFVSISQPYSLPLPPSQIGKLGGCLVICVSPIIQSYYTFLRRNFVVLLSDFRLGTCLCWCVGLSVIEVQVISYLL